MAEVAHLGRRQWYLLNVAVLALVAGYQLLPKGHNPWRFLIPALALAYAGVMVHLVVTLRDRIHDLPASHVGLRRQLMVTTALAVAMNVSHLLVARTIDWALWFAWGLGALIVLIGMPSFAIATAVRGQQALTVQRKRRKRVPGCVNDASA